MRDPENHFSVVTHQGFRDDLLHLGAQAEGIDKGAMADKVAEMSTAERKAWAGKVMADAGITPDYVMLDEAHGSLDRVGKANSTLSNVLTAVGHNSKYLALASADPVKNDSCLHPDTPIHDPVRNVTKTVMEWSVSGTAPYVVAFDVTAKQARVVLAGIPFVKSRERPMFRVVLDGGTSITVGENHRFLTCSGWRHLSDLSVGDEISVVPPALQSRTCGYSPGSPYAFPSVFPTLHRVVLRLVADVSSLPSRYLRGALRRISGLSRRAISDLCTLGSSAAFSCLCSPTIVGASFPRISHNRDDALPCARHCWHGAQGCRYDCSTCSHLYDGQPLRAQDIARDDVPSQDGALGCGSWRSLLDDRQERKPKHSRPGRCSFRPSTLDGLLRYANRSASRVLLCTGFQAEYSEGERSLGLRRAYLPFAKVFGHLRTTLRSSHAFGRIVSALPRPFSLRRSSMSCEFLVDGIKEIIKQPHADIYDLEVPGLHNYAACGVWNHNSEVYSLLEKLDPEKYADRDRFLRRYGGDTPEKKDALRREMTPYLMTGRTDPGVKVHRSERSVELNASQRTAIKRIQGHLAAARLGRIKGKPDIEALKSLSPDAFSGVSKDEEGKVAERLQRSLGVIKESAIHRAIDDMGQSAKLDEVSRIADERRGTPGVVFAHSLSVAKDLREKLEAQGHRVGLLTGEMSASERDKVRQGFHPETGDPEHDILIMSDAGAVGINAQRGRWLVQYDSPQTAMIHAQRQGRIHRLGQLNDVEMIDLVGDHPFEHNARKRLRDKYALREALTDPHAGLDDTGLAGYLAKHSEDGASGQAGLF